MDNQSPITDISAESSLSVAVPVLIDITETEEGYIIYSQQFNRFSAGKTIVEAREEMMMDLLEYFQWLHEEKYGSQDSSTL